MENRLWSGVAACVMCVGLQLAAALPAAADDAPVLVADSKDVTLTAAEDGRVIASLTLENQSNADVTLRVTTGPGVAPGCQITPAGDATLLAHQQQKVSFTFSAACLPNRTEGTNFTVTAGTSTFDIHAKPPVTPSPNWWAVLLCYVGSAAGAFLILLYTWRKWDRDKPVPGVEPKLGMPLPGLDAAWKFADSWAANATVVTALFTGLFGAKDVTTALLGDSASAVLAIAVVSAAVSLGLAGISPMVLQSLRRYSEAIAAKTGEGDRPASGAVPAGYYVTPRGLLVAGGITLTATGGQLAAILYALCGTKVMTLGSTLWIGAVAGLLLGWYAAAATRQNLTTGATPPPPKEEEAGAAVEEADLENLLGTAFAREGGSIAVLVQPTPSASIAAERPRPAGIL